MPAPVVYVVGVTVFVASAATAYVVKHHVWDPHVSPKIDSWIHEFKMKANERRLRRQTRTPMPVPVLAFPRFGRRGSDKNDDKKIEELTSPTISPPIPLQDLEMPDRNGTIRRRHAPSQNTLDEPNTSLAFDMLKPTPRVTMQPTPPASPPSPFVISEQQSDDPFHSPPTTPPVAQDEAVQATPVPPRISPSPSLSARTHSTLSTSSLSGSVSQASASENELQSPADPLSPFSFEGGSIASHSQLSLASGSAAGGYLLPSDLSSSFHSDFEHVGGSDSGLSGDWTPLHSQTQR